MWKAETESLNGERATKFSIELDGSPVFYAEVLRGWQEDEEFRSWFGGLLADSPTRLFVGRRHR